MNQPTLFDQQQMVDSINEANDILSEDEAVAFLEAEIARLRSLRPKKQRRMTWDQVRNKLR